MVLKPPLPQPPMESSTFRPGFFSLSPTICQACPDCLCVRHRRFYSHPEGIVDVRHGHRVRHHVSPGSDVAHDDFTWIFCASSENGTRVAKMEKLMRNLSIGLGHFYSSKLAIFAFLSTCFENLIF
jgi:hypothetical protein